MKILFLVDYNHYVKKMSRIRFHTITGIRDYLEIEGIGFLQQWGPNWTDWDNDKTAQQNIDQLGYVPDLVIGFKPLEINGFADITAPKCVRYNEMYDVNWTAKEIIGSKANLVICHHYNDFMEWNNKLLGTMKAPYKFQFGWVPHSIDTDIFKPIPRIKKDYDVVIMGATHVQTLLGSHYPLRERMCSVLEKMPKKYRCAVIPHVGGVHMDSYTDKYMEDFAQKLNSAKILVTCSGAPKSRFGKYLEAAACGTAVAGDVYDDHPCDVEELKEFLIEINMEMSDDEIIEKLVNYLENDTQRQKKIDAGLEYMEEYGLEQYAERFVKIAQGFLNE